MQSLLYRYRCLQCMCWRIFCVEIMDGFKQFINRKFKLIMWWLRRSKLLCWNAIERRCMLAACVKRNCTARHNVRLTVYAGNAHLPFSNWLTDICQRIFCACNS
jgi:hypothetical protein